MNSIHFESLGFGGSLSLMGSAALTAAELAKGISREAIVKDGEGHRSVITKADEESQRIIISALSRIPDAKFLCEEDSGNPRVFSKKNPKGILEGTTCVVDPIDGTARFSGRYPDWTIGIGMLCDGVIEKGVIVAPASNGGMLLASENKRGAILVETNSITRLASRSSNTHPKQSVVLFGVDASLYRNAANFMLEVTPNVRAKYDTGSGLFGLMMVALGRAQAVVQTPQKAWDWVQAYRAIIETGNVFHFFRLKDGNLIPVEHYDFEAFCSDAEHRLGFVAGEPALAQKLFDKLPKSGWERIKPDTVEGSW